MRTVILTLTAALAGAAFAAPSRAASLPTGPAIVAAAPAPTNPPKPYVPRPCKPNQKACPAD